MNGIIHVNLKTGAREVRNIARRPNFDFRQVETLKHDNLEEAQKRAAAHHHHHTNHLSCVNGVIP